MLTVQVLDKEWDSEAEEFVDTPVAAQTKSRKRRKHQGHKKKKKRTKR